MEDWINTLTMMGEEDDNTGFRSESQQSLKVKEKRERLGNNDMNKLHIA